MAHAICLLKHVTSGIDCHRWAGTEGQDFNTNSATPGIDFATIHLWVDNWLVRDSAGLNAHKAIRLPFLNRSIVLEILMISCMHAGVAARGSREGYQAIKNRSISLGLCFVCL